MEDRRRRSSLWRPAGWAIGAALVLAGCPAASIDTHLDSPYLQPWVAAIAPFMNHSGSPDVDPLAVSDLFFSELQMVRGLQVLPINRSLQAMAAMNMEAVSGPVDVVKLAEQLGADMIFVGAVTSYQPYDPPELGLAVELYMLAETGPEGAGNIHRPRAQVSAVYNAGHWIVQKQVRQYAEIREGRSSPLRWKLYVKSMQHYVRFCCHRAIRQILDQEEARIWLTARTQ